MTDNELTWLQRWYAAHCDGDWEHGEGISISTLDNPGWTVVINVADTELDHIEVDKVRVELSDTDWLIYEIRDGKFIGRGGAQNLTEVLRAFGKLVERAQS
jgi:hypothetical protein